MKNFRSLIFLSFFLKRSLHGKTPKVRITFGLGLIMAIFLVLNLFSGCYYYRATTKSHPKSSDISQLNTLDKVFVIHSGTHVFKINNITIENDSIKGNFAADYILPFQKNTFPNENSSNRYKKKKGDRRVLNEVHIYLQTTLVDVPSKVSFAARDVYRIDIYNPDTLSTSLSWVFGIAGIVIVGVPVLIILIVLILAATGASCPYIYVNTGNGFVFAGEIYSGAVYAPLERDDYLSLSTLVAENGKYTLKMANELQEIQHTNLTELIVIDHPAKSGVLVDKYGKFQTSTDIKTPISATNFIGTDILNYIKDKDSINYCGTSPGKDIQLTDGVILSFEHPKDIKSGKVFIRAKNSFWLENVYRNFHELLGSYNKAWTKKQNASDAAQLKEWSLSQKIPLSLYVEKNGEWVFCDYFNLVGPMALKDDVIAVDLKDIGNGPLRIKLESGSYFWEIDYVGIDYSLNVPVKATTVKINEAITESKENVADLLKNDDSKYYIQPETTNIAELTFAVPAVTNSKRTVILHSKGYYQINQETKGFPQAKKLKSLQEPGQFLEYSRELMKYAVENLAEK
jgi:hypothetical protein